MAEATADIKAPVEATPKADWSKEFPQDRRYFSRKYEEYNGFPLPVVRPGDPYPIHPDTGEQIRPAQGTLDNLPEKVRADLGRRAVALNERRKAAGLEDVIVHGTPKGPDIVRDGSMFKRSHFGQLDQVDLNTGVDDVTTGSLDTTKPDFFVSLPSLVQEPGDVPLSKLLLVVPNPSRAEYLARRFEEDGKHEDIILLEDLLGFMESHDGKLPALEVVEP